MTPYLIVLWGTFGGLLLRLRLTFWVPTDIILATMWAAGRKISGHNTWFGKD